MNMNEEMKAAIVKQIKEYKAASDKLATVLNFKGDQTYEGMEEHRERIESFCLSYDEHQMLNTLSEELQTAEPYIGYPNGYGYGKGIGK